jgi:hypothetical protein
MAMATKSRAWAPPDLGPLARKKKITVRAAADLNAMSEDSFRRYWSHLIRKVTPRRDAVELGDAIDLPPPPAAA